MKLNELRQIIEEEIVGVLETKPKLGSGERFKQLVKQLKSKKHEVTEDQVVRVQKLREAIRNEIGGFFEAANNPAALAAWIGRKKYGKEKYQKMAARGRKRHNEAEGDKPKYTTMTHKDGSKYNDYGVDVPGKPGHKTYTFAQNASTQASYSNRVKPKKSDN